ncbi:MAG: hypothetical protein KUG76_05990 [Gammaproteobacteria bacterium]|nr:hypothetical protein [Gammaproteobacteria bacterium]
MFNRIHKKYVGLTVLTCSLIACGGGSNDSQSDNELLGLTLNANDTSITGSQFSPKEVVSSVAEVNRGDYSFTTVEWKETIDPLNTKVLSIQLIGNEIFNLQLVVNTGSDKSGDLSKQYIYSLDCPNADPLNSADILDSEGCEAVSATFNGRNYEVTFEHSPLDLLAGMAPMELNGKLIN